MLVGLPSPPVSTPEGRVTLAIELATPAAVPRSPSEAPQTPGAAPAAAQPRPSGKARNPDKPQRPVAAPRSPGPSPADHDPPRTAPAAETPIQPVRPDPLPHLLRALAEHFEYPLPARRRGQEGEALLAVSIAPDGTLATARIAQSSGHAALDRAALDGLHRAAAHGPLVSPAPGNPLDLEVPVRFRLDPTP